MSIARNTFKTNFRSLKIERHQRLAFCLAGLLGLVCLPGRAEYNVTIVDKAPEYRQFGRVEITGSSIVNPRAREILPVRVIDQREIQRLGAQNTTELIQRLPAMHSANELGGVNSVGKGGNEAGAIHGYEAGTLVLINGRRVAPLASQRADLDRTAVDLSLLPLSAIARIEILSDGASTTYGSEAIAGVINIITQEHTDGLTLKAEMLNPQGSGGSGKTMALNWGRGKLAQDGYALQIHFEASEREALLAKERSYTDPRAKPYGVDANGRPLTFVPRYTNYSHSSPGKTYKPVETAADCTTGYDFVPDVTLSLSNPAYHGIKRCLSSTYRNSNIYPEERSQTLYAQFDRVLSAHHTLFSELSLQHAANAYTNLSPTNTALVFKAPNYYYYAPDAYQSGVRTQNNDRKRLVLGSRGSLADWDYTLSAVHSQNGTQLNEEGAYQATTSAQWTALLRPYANELVNDPASYSTGLKNALNSRIRDPRLLSEASIVQQGLELRGSKVVGETQWGDIQLGSGVFAQQQKLDITNPASPVLMPSYSAQRKNMGASLELQIPAWENLELMGAMRAEKYTGFGSVLTGKVGLKYALTEKSHLRANVGTGYRAPTLSQMTPVATYVLAGTTQNNKPLSGFALGNPNLQPEKSTQWSFGAHAQPQANWGIGADFWQIRVKDTFGTPTISQIDADPRLKAAHYTVNPDGSVRYDLLAMNLGQMEKSGIDYYVQHRLPTDWGRWLLGIEGTHNLKSRRSNYPGDPLVSDLGQYQVAYESVTPRNKIRFTSGLEQANWGINSQINYMSGNREPIPLYSVVDYRGLPVGDSYTHQVKDTWTLDVSGWHALSKSFKLHWSVTNLTNETPPERFTSLGATIISSLPRSDTRYNDYYGRTFRLTVEWKVW
ncbi:TonB-dependent siderophore receptor [Limnohabitans sp. T6-20]|uniref:TonB-dependent receptor plug domain-containing protein n=1 Tax=Limnohabitans sp. T6-20 TaxID=1100725 RepID=UPI000D34F93C|nr:TonB-dependent receptor [Limnohabitans sp. T6-20]PUE12155.1 hypothetical protein B9Z33_00915 [Limnohabitans sp. T6-20]